MTVQCKDDECVDVYCTSSFKYRHVYLILGHLGEAFIGGRPLFQQSEQKKMKSCVNSKQ